MNLPDKTNSISLTSGSLSFSSSLLMAIMIPRAHGGLSAPYRRIIFGLSISDIIQSLAIVFGPFLLPSSRGYYSDDQVLSSWAIGNVHTCDFQGFLLTFGATTTCMYTLFLCLYYYCKLKRNISDSTFRKKIETKIHCFIVLFNAIVCSIALATKTFNPLPRIGSCQLTRKPFLCDPSVPGSCERGEYAKFFNLFYFPLGLPIICLLGTLILMCSIIVRVVKRDRQFRCHDHSSSRRRNESDLGSTEDSAADNVARLLRRELTLQVVLYVLAFLLTYGWTVVLSVYEGVDIPPPFFMSTMLAMFFPLLGLFNILIYTRPQIVAYRRLHRDVSWPVAFWRVVKAGGENPDTSIQSPSSPTTTTTTTTSPHCCCLCFRRTYEKEDNDTKVISGMLRFRALCNHSTPITQSLTRHQKVGMKEQPCSVETTTTPTNCCVENKISTDVNHVEHEPEVGWKEGSNDDRLISGRIRNDKYTVHNVRDISFLSSQQDAISKAFEKAAQRVRAMNAVDHDATIQRKDNNVVPYSQWLSENRRKSEWSIGASPGSLSAAEESLLEEEDDDLELANNDDDGC